MSGPRHFSRRSYDGPRNRKAYRRGQRHLALVMQIIEAHFARNPYAKQLSAKQIHSVLPDIEPRTISHYMQQAADIGEAAAAMREQGGQQ